MRLRHVAGFFLALMAVVATWALAIPRFASPDETAHVYKAYGTAHGELLGAPAPGFSDNLREFAGPASLGPPTPCYNGRPDVPASCPVEISPRLISTAARYPPWYYGLVGIPTRVLGQADRVAAYRGFSALFCVALVTLAMWLVKRSTRSDLAPLLLVALTPMALFLMASVNPNAIEVAGFVAIWACLVRVAIDEHLPDRFLVLGAWVAAAVVLMRPIAIVWLVGSAVVVLIALSPPRRRELMTWRRLVYVAVPMVVAGAGSIVWLRYARFEVNDPRVDRSLSLASAIRQSVRLWPDTFRQTIGVLGWLDTMLPSFAYLLWIVALVIIVVVHLRHAEGRHIVAFVALIALWLALPLAINGFTHARAGLTFEGRYSLPVFVGVVFMPMWADEGDRRRRLVAALVGLVAVAEVAALWQMLRRFSVGAHGKIMLTGTLPWSPPVAPMVLIAANAGAMIAVAWSAWIPWGQVEAASGERHSHGAQHRPD